MTAPLYLLLTFAAPPLPAPQQHLVDAGAPPAPRPIYLAVHAIRDTAQACETARREQHIDGAWCARVSQGEKR